MDPSQPDPEQSDPWQPFPPTAPDDESDGQVAAEDRAALLQLLANDGIPWTRRVGPVGPILVELAAEVLELRLELELLREELAARDS